jgi:hypothetical protein
MGKGPEMRCIEEVGDGERKDPLLSESLSRLNERRVVSIGAISHWRWLNFSLAKCCRLRKGPHCTGAIHEQAMKPATEKKVNTAWLK